MNTNIIKVDNVILHENIDFINLYLPNELFDEDGDFTKSTPDDYVKLGGLNEAQAQQNIYKAKAINLIPMGDAEEPYIEIPESSSPDSVEFVNSNVTIIHYAS